MTILTPSPRTTALHTPTSKPTSPKTATISPVNNNNLLPTNPQSTSQILYILTPALTNSLLLATYIQTLLTHTTIFLLFRAHILLAFSVRQSRNALSILQYINGIGMGVVRRVWKKTEKARDKLFFEFMVFVLGGGNGLFLVLFWPGWIVVGAFLWAGWRLLF